LTDGKDISKAELHLSYQLQKDSKGNDKIKDYLSGGSGENNKIGDAFSNINLLFLPALRNAEGDLKPSRSSQLAQMLNTIAKDDVDKQRLLAEFIIANKKLREDPTIKSIEKIINGNLQSIEKEELQQNVVVNLIEPTFEAIAASLDVGYVKEHNYILIPQSVFLETIATLGISKTDFNDKYIIKKKDENLEISLMEMAKYSKFDKLRNQLETPGMNGRIALRQNGLGYNNILSMATSLGDLQKKPLDEEFSILLVEEPEAHLHPQLLDLLFNFFKKSDNQSKIQIIMTSHSPSLVAKADIDSLQLMHDVDGLTKITSLKQIKFDDVEEKNKEQKDDLKRYLDVTKSQLFFAKRVVFVEGISEALLLSEFAKMLGKPFDKYSVEIVNINGVAFEPFAKLFTNNDDKTNIQLPCAIISDNDKCTNACDQYKIKAEEIVYSNADFIALSGKIKQGDVSYRAKILSEFGRDNICVELAEKTMEYEFGLIKENNDILLEILSTEHSSIQKDIKKQIESGDSQEIIATRFWVAIKDCKGSFAQKLAAQISRISSKERNDVTFVVPQYIERAINHIIPD
jgi:putative ATP-dependent endonuclease of OLD family